MNITELILSANELDEKGLFKEADAKIAQFNQQPLQTNSQSPLLNQQTDYLKDFQPKNIPQPTVQSRGGQWDPNQKYLLDMLVSLQKKHNISDQEIYNLAYAFQPNLANNLTAYKQSIH